MNPLEIMINNAKAQRESASVFRKEAARALDRAIEADLNADRFERAAEVIKSAQI